LLLRSVILDSDNIAGFYKNRFLDTNPRQHLLYHKYFSEEKVETLSL